MKTITFLNWALLGLYGALLTYAALTTNQTNTDAAGRGLASAYILFGFLLLVAFVVMNWLPFPVTRIIVFVGVLLPLAGGIVQLVSQLATARQTELDDEGRWNGSYYFRDPLRQQLAESIAKQDMSRLQILLQQPVPQLNESGVDHYTLLDFAAMRGTYSDSSAWVLPYLTLLLAKGATIETADPLHSPTHALVSQDCSAAMLAWFLDNGANPNANRLQDKPTPILLTIIDGEKDRFEKATLLLAHGANPNAMYPPTATGWLAGHSALLAAARMDLWDVCGLLLDKGADPTISGPQKQVFTQLVARRAELYGEEGDPPAQFTALLNRLNLSSLNRP